MKPPTSPSVLVAKLERELVSQTFKGVNEANSLPSLPHTHINGSLLLICSVLWHCKHLQIHSSSHNFIKKNISQVWQFLSKETYSPSNPTLCPVTSDVMQGRGSEEHLVKRDDSVEFCKTRAGRAKHIFEGIPLKLETEGRQYNDANKIT